jgi:hypothetical protein
MADNALFTPGSGGTLRTFDDGTAEWPGNIIAFVTGGSAGSWTTQYVNATNGFPVHQQTGATWAVSLASVPSHAVTNVGVFAVQVDGNALTALQLIDDVVYIDDADWTSLTSKHALMGGIYQSTPGTITDGDTGPLRVNANGALQVAIVSGAGSGGTAITDDAAFTAATTSFTPVGGIVTADSVDSGDGGAFAMLANRQQKVTFYDSAGDEVVAATDATHDSAAPADGPMILAYASAAAPTDVTGADAVRAWALLNGSQVCNLAVGGTLVTGSAGLPVAQQGTFTVGLSAAQTLATVTTVGTVTTCSTVTTVGTLTGGGVAHDAADSGNPHKIGAKATTALSGLTLVANADRTDLMAGIDGVLITRDNSGLEDIVSGLAAITDGSSTSVIASAGAGVKVYITDVIISNSSATAVTVDLRDGAAGSVKATFPAPADVSGVVHSFKTPLPFSAATAVCADPSAAASTVTVTLVGFKSKV